MKTPEEQLRFIEAYADEHPEARIGAVLGRLKQKRKLEELRLPQHLRGGEVIEVPIDTFVHRNWLQRFVARFVEPGAY